MENWKSIKDYEGAYEVSDLGNVRSLDRLVRCNTSSQRLVKGVVMKQKLHRDGYSREAKQW